MANLRIDSRIAAHSKLVFSYSTTCSRKGRNTVSNASQRNIGKGSHERMLQMCFCHDTDHSRRVSSCGEPGCRCQRGAWSCSCAVSCDFAFLLNNVENKGLVRARLLGFLMGILLILCQLQSHYHDWIHCKLLQKLQESWRLHCRVSFHRIPSPQAPPMSVLSAVITEAFGVALVGYAASLALAQGSAKKFKYSVDDNQVEYARAPLHSYCILVPCAPRPWTCGVYEKYKFPKCITRTDRTKQKKKKSLNHSYKAGNLSCVGWFIILFHF